MPKELIKEATKSGALKGSRMEITLITPGWGSSGYYSAEVLQKAAEAKVFPARTQQHIDHDSDGGVGSVANLAAALNEDARWDPDYVDEETGQKGRLVAESRVFSHKREMLAEMKDVIGTSIAAAAEVSFGEAEGRSGRIIEALLPSKTNRVDFVTVAGRGGRIEEVLEAHKVKEARNVGQWLEARMHSMFTSISDEMYGDGRLTREERITLSAALGDALTSFTATVEASAPQLFERDLWEDPTPTAEEAAKNSASSPAAVTENQEEANMATIDDKELSDLRESASRATTAEAAITEATERVDAAEAKVKKANDKAAAAVVEQAFATAGLTAPKLAKRLAEGYTVSEDGILDSEALSAEVAESIAELQVGSGAGSVRGVGESASTTETVVDESAAHAAILAASGYTPKGA